MGAKEKDPAKDACVHYIHINIYIAEETQSFED